MQNRYISLTLLLPLMLLSSCIQTPTPDVPKRISFRLNVDNVGDVLKLGEDSIHVEEVKFLADKINITLPDSVVLQTSVDALVMRYQSDYAGNTQNVLTANIGYEGLNQFAGIELFVAPPQNDDNIQDNDFFGSETNFSYIIRGSYNGKSFDFNSSVSFKNDYNFENTVQLTDTKETMLLILRSDARQIFIDQSGNYILDPTAESNKTAIDSMFKASINVNAAASDEIY